MKVAENEILTLNAVRREGKGKSAAKQLRVEGLIPGVYYHGGTEATPLQFNLHEVQMLLKKRPTLLNLTWGKGEEDSVECMLREVQRHPVTHIPVHLDLIGITRGVKMKTSVNVQLTGTPIGVKEQGGLLQQAMSKVDIICMPRHIPQSLEIDVSGLKLGETLHLRDVVRENIEWDDDLDRTICTVVMPRLSVETDEEEAGGEAAAAGGEGGGDEESEGGEE